MNQCACTRLTTLHASLPVAFGVFLRSGAYFISIFWLCSLPLTPRAQAAKPAAPATAAATAPTKSAAAAAPAAKPAAAPAVPAARPGVGDAKIREMAETEQADEEKERVCWHRLAWGEGMERGERAQATM